MMSLWPVGTRVKRNYYDRLPSELRTIVQRCIYSIPPVFDRDRFQDLAFNRKMCLSCMQSVFTLVEPFFVFDFAVCRCLGRLCRPCSISRGDTICSGDMADCELCNCAFHREAPPLNQKRISSNKI
jgi:hypothetical protein